MMYYYCLTYLYSEEKCGVYEHLPVTSQVTRDKEEALRWFDEALKSHLSSWRGNELVKVEDCELDYMCRIKKAVFHCGEAAYMKGYYMIELSCYTHNPCE